ncbi:MAG: hypothetical protein ACR2N3_11140 [Pyrinomonadaceae bacterium]
MSEKTKRKEKRARKTEEKKKTEKKNPIGKKQTEKSYYYDDAHGYEIYKPKTSNDETNEN